MGIKKALIQQSADEQHFSREEKAPSVEMFEQSRRKATTVRLYVSDDQMLEELKTEAFLKKTSISKLFQEWASRWLEEQRGGEELEF